MAKKLPLHNDMPHDDIPCLRTSLQGVILYFCLVFSDGNTFAAMAAWLAGSSNIASALVRRCAQQHPQQMEYKRSIRLLGGSFETFI